MGRKGFTLIELLVVIAIIAILAAILFPVFARVRAKAQGTQCISNMKQIILAVRMYASDYSDVLPPCPLSWNWKWWGTVGNKYADSLGPYVQDYTGKIFICPSQTPGKVQYHTAIANAYYSNFPWASGQWQNYPLSRISAPDGDIGFADGVPYYNSWYPKTPENDYDEGWQVNSDSRGGGATCHSPSPLTAPYLVGLTADPPYWPAFQDTGPGRGCWCAWHQGMINCNFLDGHAKTMSLSTINANYGSTAGGNQYRYLTVFR